MKKELAIVLFTLVTNITSLAATIGATMLAFHDIKGWGWFLLVAVLTSSTPKFKDPAKDDEKTKDNNTVILG